MHDRFRCECGRKVTYITRKDRLHRFAPDHPMCHRCFHKMMTGYNLKPVRKMDKTEEYE